MTELREKINDIILSYCEGHYHLEFTEDDLPNILNEIEEAINYNRCCDKLPQDPIVLARYLHDNYEMIAKKQNWNTQENCKVDFSDLPVGNKNTMILLAGKLILDFGGN